MDLAIDLYVIVCYGIGAAGLITAILVCLVRPNPVETAHAAYLAAFSVLVVTFSIGILCIKTGRTLPVGLAATISILNLGSVASIAWLLPRFCHRLCPLAFGRRLEIAFGTLAFLAWVTSSLLYFTPYRIVPILAVLVLGASSIVYAMFTETLSRRWGIARLLQPAEQERWSLHMKLVSKVCLLFLPAFMVFDFFRDFLPALDAFVPSGFRAFPLFYAIWNVSYIVFAAKGLRRREGDPRAEPDLGLSPREAEVARLLADGKSYKEIADLLGISLATVKTHIARAYQKTGSGTKMDLAKALRGGQEGLPGASG